MEQSFSVYLAIRDIRVWMWMKHARALRPLTSIARVLSIILQREHKQWLRKFLEVKLDDELRINTFAMVVMADLEEHRNGMDIVCRAE